MREKDVLREVREKVSEGSEGEGRLEGSKGEGVRGK